jgi:hypothetical protein
MGLPYPYLLIDPTPLIVRLPLTAMLPTVSTSALPMLITTLWKAMLGLDPESTVRLPKLWKAIVLMPALTLPLT